jgi:hypothetical protein
MESAKQRNPARDLVLELKALRSLVDEVVSHYGLNVKARIDEILHVIEVTGGPEGSRKPADPETFRKLALKAKRVKVKPQKGRAKDLRRIQDLVDGMCEVLLDLE